MSERRNIIAWLHSPAAYLTVATAGVPASQATKACEALAKALEDGDPEGHVCICVSDAGNPECPRCGAQVQAERENNCNACMGVRVMPRDAGPHVTLSDTVPARHTCGK